MPIYEYVCDVCEAHFEHFWISISAAEKAADTPLICPTCGSQETRRTVSQIAVLGGLGGLTPAEQRSVNAQEERKASITPKEEIQRLQANRQQKNTSSS